MPDDTISAPPGFEPFERSAVEQSIPARFGQIATRWPARLAVKFGPESWTYAELNAAADRVASGVRDALGRSPEPVAVLVGQGPSLLGAILGILKAGHFYVPLDTSHPAAPG